MNQPSPFSNLAWYPAASTPGAWYYWARSPRAEQDPQGHPTLSLLVMGASGVLQLGCRWDPPPSQLEALRRHLAHGAPATDEDRPPPQAAPLTLRPAPATVEEVLLELRDQHGAWQVLASTRTSDTVPFTAIFNAQLSGDALARVQAALRGQHDILRVRYTGMLRTLVDVRAEVRGDLSGLDLPEPVLMSSTDARLALDNALEDGRLKLHATMEPPFAPSRLLDAVIEQALDNAGVVLRRLLSDAAAAADPNLLHAQAESTEYMQIPFSVSTDIAAWFVDGDGDRHIKILGGSVAPADGPPPQALAQTATVSLDFDAGDAPLALIRCGSGDHAVTLSPPDFAQVELALPDNGEPLHIETHYTDGGPNWHSELPRAPAWELTAQDLGLAHVVIDATRLQQAGASKARVTVSYEPEGAGTPDKRMFHLRRDNWRESWWLTTRSRDLDGVLGYEWKATHADGSIQNQSRQTTTQLLIEI